MCKNPEKINILDIFNDVRYIVPIYQRNYAWESVNIEQLIEDINNSEINYFLGSLVVNERDDGSYEVIDGQQRLTTLFLLNRYLGIDIDKSSLRFEVRHKSNKTLDNLDLIKKSTQDIDNKEYSESIIDGFNFIKQYFSENEANINDFKNKLNNVFIVRIKVPKNIDLNHYFEIMNTRGEQLELHEIVKAKILATFGNDNDKSIGAMIWDACSDMNSYVQMNFKSDIRNIIFKNNWTELSVSTFEDLVSKINIGKVKENKSLKELLIDSSNEGKLDNTKKVDNEENERFESIVSFPNFLLQVNLALDLDSSKSLDDKKFIENLENNWKDEKTGKDFIFNLLKYRVLFDKFIIKREFSRDYKDIGKWSLLKLKACKDKTEPSYQNSLDDELKNSQLKVLQSCLRITYTSPQTMDWIAEFLEFVGPDDNKITNESLITRLENYCRKKVKGSGYSDMTGFNIHRIAFSYLDYLIYRDRNRDSYLELKDIEKFEFQFRNSIEHFYPQNPTDLEKWIDKDKDKDKDLNCFGNLALITVSGNSRFSNLSPKSKVDTYPTIIDQSLKLKIMSKLAEGWTPEVAKKHGQEMINKLSEDIKKLS